MFKISFISTIQLCTYCQPFNVYKPNESFQWTRLRIPLSHFVSSIYNSSLQFETQKESYTERLTNRVNCGVTFHSNFSKLLYLNVLFSWLCCYKLITKYTTTLYGKFHQAFLPWRPWAWLQLFTIGRSMYTQPYLLVTSDLCTLSVQHQAGYSQWLSGHLYR